MRRLHLALPAASVVFCSLFRVACGCSSSSSSPIEEDAADARDVAKLDAVSYLDTGGPTPPLDGWVPYTDYNPDCGFWVPGSASAMPPPIRWEPCDSTATPSGSSCRQMVTDWAYPPGGGSPGGALQGWVRGDGTAFLLVWRTIDTNSFVLVAEADGPVHTAIVGTRNDQCLVSPASIQDGKYGLQIYDNFQTTDHARGGGALGGDIDAVVPDTALQFTDGADASVHEIHVGASGLLDAPVPFAFNAYAWGDHDAAAFTALWSPANEPGFAFAFPKFQSSSLFFEAYAGYYTKIKLLTSAGTAVDFIAYGGGSDFSHAAGDFGTDGHDMVWSEGTGGTDGGLFANVDLFTAPFTTNPADVAKRRLRSEVANGFGVSAFLVGCGFAARATYQGIRIVRLADGLSWQMPSDPDPHSWAWTEPVAVTCSELFASVSIPNPTPHLGLARVRLDSLGPGIPPD